MAAAKSGYTGTNLTDAVTTAATQIGDVDGGEIGTDQSDDFTGSARGDAYDGLAGDDIIHGGDGNDRLIGNTGNDELYGEADDDILDGGPGGDILDGGSGEDTATYASSAAFVSINLKAGTASGGDATGDTLFGIEHLIGSGFGDTLLGGTGNNTIAGGGGNDVITGDAGSDTLFGGDGNDEIEGGNASDTLFGGDGNDTLDGGNGTDISWGGNGDDTFVGSTGADEFFGGAGSDTADYSAVFQSLDIDLTAGIAKRGSSTDGLHSIENVLGGSDDDTIIGNAADNALDGGADDDRLIGRAGSDELTGGTGNDTLVFESTGDVTLHALNTVRGADEFGDLIHGFETGSDTLEFDGLAFDFEPGTTLTNGADFFVIDTAYSGTIPGSETSFPAFIYSTADDTLYYDANPTADGYHIVATVQSGDDIAANDITFVSAA